MRVSRTYVQSQTTIVLDENEHRELLDTLVSTIKYMSTIPKAHRPHEYRNVLANLRNNLRDV